MIKNNIFLTSDAATVMSDLVQHIDVKENKRLLFVDTAVEPIEGEKIWIDSAKVEIQKVGFEIQEYTITDKTSEQIKQVLAEIDILYIAGGNVFYLLQKIKEVGFVDIVQNFVKDGGIYIGQSAGSYLASKNVEYAYTPSRAELADKLDNFNSFDLVDFNVIAHFGSEDSKKAFLEYRAEHIYDEKNKIILLTDNQYIRVQEDGMYKIEEIVCN